MCCSSYRQGCSSAVPCASESFWHAHLSASRPRIVVSTLIALSASPFGFSAKSTMRPLSSIFISPNAWAFFSLEGSAATVMSAPVLRCFSTKSW